jgi:serine/threonine protein kinase
MSAQWDEEHLYIVMELKPGNVESLIRMDLYVQQPSSAETLLKHMLQALDYLVSESIIHRDVKPENILYSPLPDGGYEYQLADFGLANVISNAQTDAGTTVFKAPELDSHPKGQTSKVDVWSLFVTLAYAMNVGGSREKPVIHNPPENYRGSRGG